MRPEQIAARARACIGVRFRPQGRDPALGLDCVGLVAFAADLRDVISDYALRGDHDAWIEAEARRVRLEPGDPGKPRLGDILVFDAGPAQFHLGVSTGSGLVHADAGLRRVAERPLPFAWPLLAVWRRVGES